MTRALETIKEAYYKKVAELDKTAETFEIEYKRITAELRTLFDNEAKDKNRLNAEIKVLEDEFYMTREESGRDDLWLLTDREEEDEYV